MIEKEGPDTVAAFIAEPVMGAGGALMPPEGYFAKIQAVCDRHDVLFIADEVITGFGRLGHMWGSQAFGIRPDTISFAKAVTSAYLPLGGVMVNEADLPGAPRREPQDRPLRATATPIRATRSAAPSR